MTTRGTWRLARFIKLYLDVTWWLTIVAMVVLCLALVYPILILGVPEEHEALDMPVLLRFSLDEPVSQVTTPRSGREEILPLRGQGEITLFTRSRRAWVLWIGPMLLIFGVGLYTLWHLRTLFASISSGEPFRPENARHVQRIGFVVVGWSLLAPLAKYFGARAMLEQFSVEGMTLKPPIEGEPNLLFFGLAILVLAEILRRAAELQHDQSLTV